MSDIKWQEGVVCFAGGKYWYSINDNHKRLVDDSAVCVDIETLIKSPDFKLNTIKQGDYIEAPELDTEQKYNNAVDVFELFGFDCGYYSWFKYEASRYNKFVCEGGELDSCVNEYGGCNRKLTYPQLMAIGKLKRAMIEREKSGPNKATDLTPDVVNKPLHYQFFEGVEVIEIIASSMTCEQFKGYCLGNRIKYRLRAGNKDDVSQEIAKSDKYVDLYDRHKHLCK